MILPLVAAGAVVAAAGIATGLVGGIQAASATRKIAKKNAQLIKWEGDVNATRQRMETRQLYGQQKAGFAGAGVLTTNGSASDTLRNTAIQGEKDALTILYKAKKEAHIVRMGGSAQASSLQYGAIAGALRSGGSMMMMGGGGGS